MGNNISRYYGAYAKCLKPIKVTEKKSIVCSECNHDTINIYTDEYNKSQKFCPSCGFPLVEKIKKIENRETKHGEVRDTFGDSLNYFIFDEKPLKDYDIFVDSKGNSNCGVYLNNEYDLIVEFSKNDYYIHNFTERFKKELEYLHSLYENVSIECGYIQCWEK